MKWSEVVNYIIQSLVTAPLISKRLSIVICHSVAHLVVSSLVEAKIINVYL